MANRRVVRTLSPKMAKYDNRKSLFTRFNAEDTEYLKTISEHWLPVPSKHNSTAFIMKPVSASIKGAVKLEDTGQFEVRESVYPELYSAVSGAAFGMSQTRAQVWADGTVWVDVPPFSERSPINRRPASGPSPVSQGELAL